MRLILETWRYFNLVMLFWHETASISITVLFSTELRERNNIWYSSVQFLKNVLVALLFSWPIKYCSWSFVLSLKVQCHLRILTGRKQFNGLNVNTREMWVIHSHNNCSLTGCFGEWRAPASVTSPVWRKLYIEIHSWLSIKYTDMHKWPTHFLWPMNAQSCYASH